MKHHLYIILEINRDAIVLSKMTKAQKNTQGHPITKPKSKLMQTWWEQGKVLSWDGRNGLDWMN
jgi:mevalonate pyrophosphate decarboxylase